MRPNLGRMAVFILLGVAAACTNGPTKGVGVRQSIRLMQSGGAEDLNDRGVAELQAGHYQAAIKDFSQALMIYPQYATALNNRGNAYHQAGQPDKAIADYSQVIKIAPEFAPAYSNRGNVYADQGQYGLAIADYTTALRYARSRRVRIATIYDRASAYRSNHDCANAIADFTRIIKENYNATVTGAAYLDRGSCEEGNGDLADAIADYGESIRTDPSQWKAYDNRCFARAVMNTMLDAALADCAHAIALQGGSPKAHTLESRGFVDLRLKRYRQAIADYDAALKLDPKMQRSLFGRGIAKLHLGGTAGGKADMAAAERLSPGIGADFAAHGFRP